MKYQDYSDCFELQTNTITSSHQQSYWSSFYPIKIGLHQGYILTPILSWITHPRLSHVENAQNAHLVVYLSQHPEEWQEERPLCILSLWSCRNPEYHNSAFHSFLGSSKCGTSYLSKFFLLLQSFLSINLILTHLKSHSSGYHSPVVLRLFACVVSFINT